MREYVVAGLPTAGLSEARIRSALERADALDRGAGTCEPSCTCSLRAVDGGDEPQDDTFEITIVGPFGTYTAADNLRSGNIKVRS